MDARQVSVHRLTWAGAAVTGLLLSGCGVPRPKLPKNVKELREKAFGKRQKGDQTPLIVTGSGNNFTVDDSETGKHVLEAKSEDVEGLIHQAQGLQGPVKLRNVKAKLYQDGKPQMDLTTPFGIWDGERLTSDQTAHGVTTDGKTIIDGQKAVWTSKSGVIDLDDAKVQTLDNGKVNFTGTGPKAHVDGPIVTMPNTGKGWNPDGQQLTGDRIRWHRDTGKLEAEGHVVVIDTGTTCWGDHLRSDTKLKKGRLWGRTKVVTRKVGKKAGGAGKAGKKNKP